jgi:hypothetical protein
LTWRRGTKNPEAEARKQAQRARVAKATVENWIAEAEDFGRESDSLT